MERREREFRGSVNARVRANGMRGKIPYRSLERDQMPGNARARARPAVKREHERRTGDVVKGAAC